MQADSSNVTRFFDACAAGDIATVRDLLARDPKLVRQTDPRGRHSGWTGLHTAAQGAHADVVRLLLQHGADANAREAGDNTSPLFWAAATGEPETVRALLDAGADAAATGDAHELDVIGWGSFYHGPADDAPGMSAPRREMLSLLVERGAKHHIFSAISVGDLDLVRQVVEQQPAALDRRMSRFEDGQTPLHFAMNRKRYDVLSLLIELGEDLNAADAHGHTALEVAMLRGDREAMIRLNAAGAMQPPLNPSTDIGPDMAALAGSVEKNVPMLMVPDVALALDWYRSIGFQEVARYDDDGHVNFGMVSFGKAELMFNMHGKPGQHDVSVWFYTDAVDRLYALLKARQIQHARDVLDGLGNDSQGIEFDQDIGDMFYGARQFCIRDLNGYRLYFIQDTAAPS